MPGVHGRSWLSFVVVVIVWGWSKGFALIGDGLGVMVRCGGFGFGEVFCVDGVGFGFC